MGPGVGHLTQRLPLQADVASLVRRGWARAGLGPPPDDLRAFAIGSAPDQLAVDPADVGPARSSVATDVEGGAKDPVALCHQMGLEYEAQLDAAARASGAHYTPLDVAVALTSTVLEEGPGGPTAGPGSAGRPTTPSRAAEAAVGPEPASPVSKEPSPTVWDPACGAGVFLLAAAEALRSGGIAPLRVVEELVWGTDIDPGAIAVAEASLVLWATLHGAANARPRDHLQVADALLAAPPAPPAGLAEPPAELCADPVSAPSGREGGFRFVLGNPPFQGQLTGRSVRSETTRAELRRRWADVVGPYTDTATLFMVAGIEALGPGGRMGMILPTSVLSARDAAPARAHVDRSARLTGMWVATEPVFDAAVEVWAPVLERPALSTPSGLGARTGPSATTPGSRTAEDVRRWRGRGFEPLPPGRRYPGVGWEPGAGGTSTGQQRWSVLAMAALDVPVPQHRAGASLATVAVASSGFRDEYYGLVGHVIDLPPGADEPSLGSGLRPLVTSGAIDPGRCSWGEAPIRFAKATYSRPAVDVASLASAAAAGGPAERAATWARSTEGPKVVVATQTKVGEAAVDEEGTWLPSTPTVALRLGGDGRVDPGDGPVPGDHQVDRLWALAAVICSPLGTVLGLAGSFGSARSAGAIKFSSSSLLDLPLPVDAAAWREGAAALRSHDRERFVTAMSTAYEVRAGDARALNGWWEARVRW